MRTIHKFVLNAETRNILTLPRLSDILSAAEQRGEIVLYVQLDTGELEKEKVEIFVFGTGHNIDAMPEDSSQFVGTVKLLDGSLMFHVFANWDIEEELGDTETDELVEDDE